MEESTPTKSRSAFAHIFFSAGEKRLRSGWRIMGQLFLLFIFFIIFGVLIGIFYLMLNMPLTGSALIIVELVLFSSITISVYLARRFLDRRTFVSLGLSLDSWAIRDLLFGIFLAGLMMGLVYMIEWALGWLTFESYFWQEQGTFPSLFGMTAMFAVFIIVGWQEELLSRGYWLQNMEEGLNLFWAVLLSSSLFALAHLGNPNSSWIAILGLVLAGVFLAYGCLRTRQLWLPIGLHIGWNFFEGPVFGFPVSGLTDMPSLLIHTVSGPEIVTGGAFGPEAGLVIIPAMALGALAIFWYTRDRLSDSPSRTDTHS